MTTRQLAQNLAALVIVELNKFQGFSAVSGDLSEVSLLEILNERIETYLIREFGNTIVMVK